MKRFEVLLTYSVAPKVPGRSREHVLADLIGPGHRLSVLGEDVLSVMVRLRAETEGDAVDVVDDRVRGVWPMVAGGTLTLATAVANGDLVPVGARRPGPAAPRGGDAPGGRAGRRGLLGLAGFRRSDDPDEGDGWDEGGSAGVREPRRPRTPPGHLGAALEEPPGWADDEDLDAEASAAAFTDRTGVRDGTGILDGTGRLAG